VFGSKHLASKLMIIEMNGLVFSSPFMIKAYSPENAPGMLRSIATAFPLS
jgi:hypothetical protein